MDKAVILAGGLGTRMRRQDESARLTAEQAQVADTGVKALIPIHRPFLDYVLTELAEAGYTRVCLVIGPNHQHVRDYYDRQSPPKRMTIEYAVQPEPLGTANAVASAEAFVGDDDFLMINSDNHYPYDAVSALRGLSGPGLAAFEREGMLAGSNIPAERLMKFAVADIGPDDYLRRVIEKPTPDQLAELGEPVYLSMNCWRFTPRIFTACRRIPKSPRGEYEVTDAAQYCIDQLGERFRVIRCKSPVLDLSSRRDVTPVAALLADREVLY